MTKARDLASAAPAPSTVSATELGYLDGVSSAIQTQIDSKIGSASAINPTIVDAKGDIIAATAADTVARLAVGSNDQVLTADSSTATGLKWATPASGSTFVGCQLEKITSDQSISNATPTAVTFNSEVFDTNGFHDNSTNNSRITIPSGKAGKYLLTSQITFATNGTGTRIVKIYKNGSLFALPNISVASSSDYIAFNSTTLVDAAVGDYYEVYAEQSSGGNLNLNRSVGNGVGCFFGITLVGV